MTDQEKREVRSGLARVVGALAGAWWLGMYSARTPEERELLQRIDEEMGERPEAPGEPDETPLGLRVEPEPEQAERLVPITDAEFLAVFDELVARYKLLEQAYARGMITATTPEQERQLEELRELLD
ncbi:MAG: hypothetical protein M3Y75_09450 [Actinomycetota bacterium]|nr:hypothetical protein [Actinomycetota bacterium]